MSYINTQTQFIIEKSQYKKNKVKNEAMKLYIYIIYRHTNPIHNKH